MHILRRFPSRARPGAPYLAGAPLLIAHRGGAGLAPENTLLAFRQAIDWWGSDILEIDVQVTSDGEVVVLHDADVDRTTDGSGPAASFTFEEIRRLDAGFHFSPDGGRTHPYRGTGVTIPSLAEVLAAFPSERLNVEIKAEAAQVRARQLIEEAGAESRVLVAAEAKSARSRFGDYRGPLSASGKELRSFHLLHRMRLARILRPRIDALQMPRRYRGRDVVSPRLVADAHAHNLAVHVWTVDDAAEMSRLVQWGVDGIVTDRPDRLAQVLHDCRGRPLPPGPPGEAKVAFLERLLLA